MSERADVVVIGGGIVGLATARALTLADPRLRVVVLEKEPQISQHQSGRNSGVLHAGVYYKPGSAKARLCFEGRERMVEFCRERGIAHEVCGKVVVAVENAERGRLADLHQRCIANGVDVELIGPERLREIEPHATGVEALHVRSTGIADFVGVCAAFAQDVVTAGGEVRTATTVVGATTHGDTLRIETTRGDVEARAVVNCGGLHADRVARMLGGEDAAAGMAIIPFRGEYYELAESRTHLVRALIYPVPDPQFPFLGVHLTRNTHGRIHAGPNAVLALRREGYSWREISARETWWTLAFPGFRRLARAHWRYGLSEMRRSLSRRRFAAALARLVPEVTAADLEPAAAGVRAQAVDRDGKLADDFVFARSNHGRALHVLNAPSPAATASLAIGDSIASELLSSLA